MSDHYSNYYRERDYTSDTGAAGERISDRGMLSGESVSGTPSGMLGGVPSVSEGVPSDHPAHVSQGVRPVTHAVYRLAQDAAGRIHASGDSGDKAFSRRGYSLFKHGDKHWTRRFGHEVADLLLAAEPELFCRARPDEVLLAPFPYKYVPTAAALMVEHTVLRLNHELSARGRPSVGRLHAFKYPWRASVEHHFPSMCESERRSVLDRIGLSVDENRLCGTHLIVVDDVRVTGASLDRFLKLLLGIKDLASLTVVFLCEVDPVLAAADPAVESRLNHHEVKTLGDVAAIAAAGGLRWNIRVTKFVLEERDPEVFAGFIGSLSDHLLSMLYEAVMLNDYHLEPTYERPVLALRSEVEARNLM